MNDNTTALKNGSATKITIFKDGEEITFTLAVVERLGFSWREDEKVMDREFKFVDVEHDLLLGSIYSGGVTGAGCDHVESLADSKWTVITTDPLEIDAMGRKADADRQEAAARKAANIAKAVDLINALPTEFMVARTDEYEFFVRRSDAVYNPTYSRKFRPTIRAMMRRRTSGQTAEYSIDFDRYYSRSGKFNKKAAAQLIDGHGVTILPELYAKAKQVSTMVDGIVSACNAYN